MSQILETHKKEIESQVASHSENPTLYTRSSRCRETCWRLRSCPTRGQGGRSGGGTRPRDNHTSMLETTVSILVSSCINLLGFSVGLLSTVLGFSI